MYGRFLLAYYTQRPRDKNKSNHKNQSKFNLATDEQIGFAIKLSEKDILNASVVLDLDNEKTIRARHNFGNEYNKLYNYYYSHYRKDIDRFMGRTEPEADDSSVEVEDVEVKED
jgi:hypothetical protein